MQRQLVGQVATLGHLDRVDFTDEVGDRGVGCGQLLAEAFAAVHPVDRRVVTEFGDEVAGMLRDRRVRVVVDLAAGDDRHPLVEQTRERADHARLRLPSLAEEDHVVARQQRVLQLRHHRVLVARHAREQRLARSNLLDGVLANLLLDGPRHPPRLAQRTQRRREMCRSIHCRVSHGPNLALRPRTRLAERRRRARRC